MSALRQLIRKRPQLAALTFGLICALMLGITGAFAAEIYLRWAERNRQDSREVFVEDAPVMLPKTKGNGTLTATPQPTTAAIAVSGPRNVAIPKPTVSNDVGTISPDNRRIYNDDPIFGYVHVPNTRGTEIKKKGDKIIYKGTYTTDAFGRRVTPQPEGPPPERAVIFVGCSYTFGLCVNDDQTMPWQFALNAPDRAVYNYGVAGYGPQHTLELFKTPIETQMPQKKAIVIYSFIREHINRCVGSPKLVRAYADRFPWYEIDESTQRPVRKGIFKERPAQPSDTGSKLVDAARDKAAETMTKKDARLTALVLDEARMLFEKKFESEGFYVLLYPGRQNEMSDEMAGILKARGAKILDYRNIVGSKESETDRWFIAGDNHPTPELHKKIAEKLVQDLGIQSNK